MPAPGFRMGNSSSTVIGIGLEILPRIEVVVVRAAPLAFRLPRPLFLLMIVRGRCGVGEQRGIVGVSSGQ
jgi:hypothetical protein